MKKIKKDFGESWQHHFYLPFYDKRREREMPLGDSVVAQNYILMTAMLQAVTQKARASVAAYGPALADYLSLFQRDFRAKCDTALYREAVSDCQHAPAEWWKLFLFC
jgi:hypothetical protein